LPGKFRFVAPEPFGVTSPGRIEAPDLFSQVK
jgi:hypothetical protein